MIEITRKRRSAGGFSLAEALLALVLLGGVLAAVVTYLVQNHGALVRMEDMVRFHGRGLQVVEAAVRQDFKDLVSKTPGEVQRWADDVVKDSGLEGAVVEARLDGVDGEPRMRILQVRVQWDDPRSIGRRIEYRTSLHRLLTSQSDSLTVPLGLDR